MYAKHLSCKRILLRVKLLRTFVIYTYEPNSEIVKIEQDRY